MPKFLAYICLTNTESKNYFLFSHKLLNNNAIFY